MTKKNLKPQQAEPVQRRINTLSSQQSVGLIPLHVTFDEIGGIETLYPFAGDDAE